MKFKLSDKTMRKIGRIRLGAKQHSPEVFVAFGVVGMIATTVMACKATTKLSGILEETKENLDQMRDYVEEHGYSEEYSEKDHQKDTTIVYAKMGVNLVKLYGPSIALGALSVGCVLASHRILSKRNAGLAAAYTALDKGFKDYRERVVEKFGEDLDRELKYGVKKETVETTEVNDKGKEKTVKKEAKTIDPEAISEYAKFFDDGCTGWTKDPNANLMFLRHQQEWATDKLRRCGFLFLDEVYQALGIPITPESRVVGWIYDEENPNGDNFVDFGIYDDAGNSRRRDFVNGYERTILLDFNVDGPILDKFSKTRRA